MARWAFRNAYGKYPQDLGRAQLMVQDGNKAGICTNTVGVGPDFLEDLLLEMARAGDGTFR